MEPAPEVTAEQKESSNLGFCIGLALNFSLLVYTAFKLGHLVTDRARRHEFDKQHHGKFRTLVFFLIFAALILRCLFEANQIYNYLKNDTVTGLKVYIHAIIDVMPIMIFVSIASLFSNFWQRLYTSFEDDDIGLKGNKSYENWLIAGNATVYFAFFLVGLLYCITGSIYKLMLIYLIVASCLACVTVLLYVTGKRLLTRTLQFVTYTGRTMKSWRGFLVIYYLLIACCVIKCIEEILYLIAVAELKTPGTILDVIRGSKWYYFFYIVYVLTVYVFGETTLFICLIFLLNLYAVKSQVFLSDSRSEERVMPSPNSHSQNNSLSLKLEGSSIGNA